MVPIEVFTGRPPDWYCRKSAPVKPKGAGCWLYAAVSPKEKGVVAVCIKFWCRAGPRRADDLPCVGTIAFSKPEFAGEHLYMFTRLCYE